MLVRVRLHPRTQNLQRLFVPKDALVRSPFSTVVWVVRNSPDKGSTAAQVQVTPGENNDGRVAIEPEDGKVNDGDWVVVQGNERLRPGSRVKIIERVR